MSERSTTPQANNDGPSADREFDLVLFGGTGFTGSLVAEYLLRCEALDVSRWALAGRNRVKLTELRARLTKISPEAKSLTLITADSGDPESLRAMAARTRVVLTTVGPYALYGEPLVAACVDAGCDYVDLTGEPTWYKEMIARYDEAAKAKGLRIVSCCGFDSIPHDLGALYTVRAFDPPLAPDEAVQMNAYVAAKGSFSGGTWASALNHFGEMRSKSKSKSSTSSAHRSERHVSGADRSKTRGPHRAREIGDKWVVPMPTIDPMVVRRSAKVVESFPTDFRYHHYMSLKDTKMLVGLLGGVGSVVALSQFGPTRRLLKRLRPSGAGPSQEQRAKSWFKVTFVARGGGQELTTCVSGGDPGYDETAKMIAESAMCLAFDRDQLPPHTGVTTPAAAMGSALITRLQRAGISFRVLERSAASPGGSV